MDERTIKIRVGIVVVVAAIVAFSLVLFFGEKRPLFQSKKTVYFRFDNAPGAATDTPVRKNGVLVGRVTSVELLDKGGVLITASLSNKYNIRRSDGVVIRSGSLIGDAVLEFVPKNSANASSNELIADQEYIDETAVANDPIQVLVGLQQKVEQVAVQIESASHSLANAGDKFAVLAENMNAVVENNGDQFHRIIQKTEVAMDHFHSAMITFDSLLGDPEFKQDLQKSIRQFPKFFEDAHETLVDARKTLQSFQQTAARADATFENLERFTAPLADRGDKFVENAQQAVANVNELLEQLVEFSNALNSNDGTLGRLIHDREVYDSMKRAIANLETESRRLRPIIENVTIFTDKLARDPRELGVKGALDRRPLGVGQKYNSGTTGE